MLFFSVVFVESLASFRLVPRDPRIFNVFRSLHLSSFFLPSSGAAEEEGEGSPASPKNPFPRKTKEKKKVLGG